MKHRSKPQRTIKTLKCCCSNIHHIVELCDIVRTFIAALKFRVAVQ